MQNTESEFAMAFIRGIGWAIMGLGIGFSAGLLKPEKKRMLFCMLGGLFGGFLGGFAFNYICDIPWAILGETDTGIIPRAVGITATGLLVGLGVGLLEQFAKSAWLKVIRASSRARNNWSLRGRPASATKAGTPSCSLRISWWASITAISSRRATAMCW